MELPLGASTLSHKSIQDPFAKPRFPSVRDASQQSWKDASALSCSPEGMGLWGGLGSDGTDGPDVDGREGTDNLLSLANEQDSGLDRAAWRGV